MSTPSFVITDAGLRAALMANEEGFKVVLKKFSLGSAFGYLPTPEDSQLKGNILYTASPSAYSYRDKNTIMITCTVPQSAGPFDFGEIGLYMEDGTLFALASWDSLITKYSYLESEVASSITFYCYLSISQGVSVVTIDYGENPTSIVEILDVESWDAVLPPDEMTQIVPELIVHENNPMGDAILLTRTAFNKWSIASGYVPEFTKVNILASTNSYLEIACGAPGIDPSKYNVTNVSGAYLMGFSDSTFAPFERVEYLASSNRLRLYYKRVVDTPRDLVSNCVLYVASQYKRVISLNNLAGGITWDDIQNKPTTFEGYGLTVPSNEIGCVSCVCTENIPVGKMIAMGQTLAISQFRKLFNIIGTYYGGDGVNTFKLPDLRGYFLRFADYNRGSDVGRRVGTTQDDGAPNIQGSGLYAENYTAGEFQGQCTGCVYVDTGRGRGFIGSGDTDHDNYVQAIDASRNSPVYGRSPKEIRVKNIALIGVITYA